MKDRVAKLAVGLASDCDRPENDVSSLLRGNLKNANVLPFAAFVTPDLKWVAGFSGGRSASQFVEILDEVEKSPLLDASEAVAKKLGSLADRARKSADRGDWKTVVKAGRDAEGLSGRCPGREALDGLVKSARAWAAKEMDGVVRSVAGGGDPAAARTALLEVKKQFAGEPEYEDAEDGLKALQRLQGILKVESGETSASPEGLREKAAADFAGSRWEGIFRKGTADGDGDAGDGGAESGE